MRWLLLLLVLLTAPSVRADPVTLFEGGFQAELPVVFRAWDQAAIDKLFEGSRSRPAAVFATPDGETRVSLTHATSPLLAADLDQTRQVLHSKVESESQVRWVRDEMITLNGSPWFRLDYDLVEADKREIVMGTSLRGTLLFLVVSTPLESLEMMEPELASLLDSMRLDQEPGAP
jgi:hypothetical protein